MWKSYIRWWFETQEIKIIIIIRWFKTQEIKILFESVSLGPVPSRVSCDSAWPVCVCAGQCSLSATQGGSPPSSICICFVDVWILWGCTFFQWIAAQLLLAPYFLPPRAWVPFCYNTTWNWTQRIQKVERACQPGHSGLAQLLCGGGVEWCVIRLC